ncbi:MAG: M28 family peptidase, partial [Pseudomonadota bacterium]
LPLLGLFYPRRGNFITVIGDLAQMADVRQVKAAMRGGSALPVHSFNGPRLVPGLDMSDHLNFWKAGYPAVMVTDTAFYRNPNYHSATDTPDTLDYPRMAQVVQGVYAAVLTLTAQ